MKLNRIEIDGFGKLVKAAYEFCPGMNLIYGCNEAGKSTLQRAIFVALYGFFDDGFITAAKKGVFASYEPWDPKAPYGLRLIFEVDDGSQYRVDRSFAPKVETNLYDMKSRKNLNSRYHSLTQGRLFFAEKLLGMPREVFENTCMVRQAELVAVEKSASAITDALLRLSASASQESTTSQALGFLETAYKEQVGTQRSRNKPLPEAQRRLENLQNSRVSLQAEYQALDNQLHELAQVEETYEGLLRERDKAEYQSLLAQLQAIRQQRLSIELADTEVERSRKEVEKFQPWSTFPVDSQPKIQRLTAQQEKATSDLQQARRTAEIAIQLLYDLRLQLSDLHKSINGAKGLVEIPDLMKLSATEAYNALQTWLDEEFSNLTNEIQNRQKAFELRTKKYIGLIQIGHESISKDRQELGRLEHDCLTADQAIQPIIQAAKQSGVPEEEWEIIFSNAQNQVTRWIKWSNYPIHLRDELLQFKAQYTHLNQILITESDKALVQRNELAQLQMQIEELKRQIANLENVRNVPQQEKPRIEEILFQLNVASQTVEDSSQQYNNLDGEYKDKLQTFNLEKENVECLNQLGIAGLTTFQQRWLNATNLLTSAQSRLTQSQEAWNQVGMSVAEFERLEKAVIEIKNGHQPIPQPRRGCLSLLLRVWDYVRSIFTSRKPELKNQTPAELEIYSKLQPIYADFVHQRDEITNCENALQQVENELRSCLGDLVPEVIKEDTFNNLLQRLQDHQSKALYIEQLRNTWESHHNLVEQNRKSENVITTRLESELEGCGFTEGSIENRLELFFIACTQKEELINAQNNLERLESHAAILTQKIEQYQLQQRSLAEVETNIINLLAKADIQAKADSLLEDFQQFEQGLENYHQWNEAQTQQEQIQKRIAAYKEQLSNARSTVSSKKEIFIKFKRSLVDKYISLLPSDFTDQDLAKLDAELQFQRSAQSDIERMQGQLERLRLQTQTIRSDLKNWVDKEIITKGIEVEILQIISAAGIRIDQLSLPDALQSFVKAFNGYLNWQKAQQTFNSAVQAQQAVHTSLPKIENELARIEAIIAEMVKQHPEYKKLTVINKPEVHEKSLQKMNDQVLQERDHLTRLQDSVNRTVKNLHHLAELDEELALANSDVQQLVYFGQILEIAISELTVATNEFQKMFAPRLERIVEKGLDQITNGRYQQVRIDPVSLNVSVLAPERKEKVLAEQLSTGTRDLIYLMLRMGIAQMMSNSGEKLPLLLDDPLVELDNFRQQASLDFLQKLSGQTQMLLFTKDQNILNWVKKEYSSDTQSRIIELR